MKLVERKFNQKERDSENFLYRCLSMLDYLVTKVGPFREQPHLFDLLESALNPIFLKLNLKDQHYSDDEMVELLVNVISTRGSEFRFTLEMSSITLEASIAAIRNKSLNTDSTVVVYRCMNTFCFYGKQFLVNHQEVLETILSHVDSDDMSSDSNKYYAIHGVIEVVFL